MMVVILRKVFIILLWIVGNIGFFMRWLLKGSIVVNLLFMILVFMLRNLV